MKLALLTFVVLLSCSLSTAFFQNTNCPNCARPCNYNFGCTQCNPGYCIKVHARFGVCVRSCGSGSFCNPVGWCNDCDVSHCLSCSRKRQCTVCERNYRLSLGSCIRDYGK